MPGIEASSPSRPDTQRPLFIETSNLPPPPEALTLNAPPAPDLATYCPPGAPAYIIDLQFWPEQKP